jgi:hypothetical protein
VETYWRSEKCGDVNAQFLGLMPRSWIRISGLREREILGSEEGYIVREKG